MAILSIEDLDTEPKYTEEQNGAYTYVTRHLLTADGTTDTEATLKADAAMPVPHVTTLAFDTLATCRTRSLQRWENARQWYLTIKWSTHREEENDDTDPFARAVVGGIRCVDKVSPAFEDSRGIMARTTAGDLYKGLTRVDNVEVIEVDLYSEEYPFSLRSINNTVNSGMVTMFGELYAARTLWMKNLRLPKKPTEQWGTHFWLTTFELHHDAAGYYELLPNAGLHELQYWTRTEDQAGPPRTFNDWAAVDFDTYDAESDDELRQITRERISTGSQQSVAGEVWLNENGEAVVPSLLQGTGTASVTNGFPTVTLTGVTLDDTYIGTMATLLFPGFNGQQTPVKVRVTSVAVGGASFDTTANFHLTAASVPIQFAGAGALFNYLEMQTQTSWSAVPLPATPPVLGN